MGYFTHGKADGFSKVLIFHNYVKVLTCRNYTKVPYYDVVTAHSFAKFQCPRPGFVSVTVYVSVPVSMSMLIFTFKFIFFFYSFSFLCIFSSLGSFSCNMFMLSIEMHHEYAVRYEHAIWAYSLDMQHRQEAWRHGSAA
jgi:hypothetical protein